MWGLARRTCPVPWLEGFYPVSGRSIVTLTQLGGCHFGVLRPWRSLPLCGLQVGFIGLRGASVVDFPSKAHCWGDQALPLCYRVGWFACRLVAVRLWRGYSSGIHDRLLALLEFCFFLKKFCGPPHMNHAHVFNIIYN